MAGPGRLSVNQNPVQGDKTALDKMRKSTKPLPMSGAQVQKRAAGRPPTGGSQQQGGNVPPQVAAAWDKMARAQRTLEFWTSMAAQGNDPVTAYHLYHAQENFKRISRKTYGAMPNFE